MASCPDRCCLYDTQQIIRQRRLISLAILLLVAALSAFLTISLAVTPRLNATIDDARLNTFTFTFTSSYLTYNLSLAVTVTNPNKAIGISHTAPLVAVLAFHDRRLLRNSSTLVLVGEGYQQRPGKARRVVVVPAVEGRMSGGLLGAAAEEEFRRQNATGVFEVDLLLSGEIKNYPLVIVRKREVGARCALRLQIAPPGPEVVVFHQVNCEPAKPDNMFF
uniref:Late embryogenesis abundant protein LEA-2 subgroup domain-containing protein n=1 Tax=Leersia perrieri TaxID=77586 RepID=A0A0D9XT52_9ORYZ